MIKRGDIDGYSRWNNDVERGKRPKDENWSESVRAFVEYGRVWRAIRRAKIERNTGKNEGKKGKIKQKSKDDIRYSKDSFLLSISEYAKLMELIGNKKNGEVFSKTRNGETIYTVGNKLVYSKGSYMVE